MPILNFGVVKTALDSIGEAFLSLVRSPTSEI